MTGDLLLPQHDRDPFCTCPKCRLLGHHRVEPDVFHTRKLDTGNGDTVEIVTFSDPPDGTPVIYRTCAFCGHKWLRIAEETL